MRIGFIGAGKVGVSLGKYFKNYGEDVRGYFSKSPSSSEFAAQFVGCEAFAGEAELVRQCDIIFVTVPDAQIKCVWEDLRKLDIKDKIICHTSGSQSSDIFDGAREMGAFAFGVHPLQAISDKTNSVSLLQDAVFTVEGDEEKIEFILTFMQKFGNTVITIDKNDKTLYHAAAVFASNLPVALCYMGEEMLVRCGFSKAEAQKALAPLIEGAAKNIANKGAAQALTGPVERGDFRTVQSHLGVLNDEEKEIYLGLTEKLITVAQEKNPDRDYSNIKNGIAHYSKSEG